MSRPQFLGNTDVGITTSLLSNYNIAAKLADSIELNKIKHLGCDGGVG